MIKPLNDKLIKEITVALDNRDINRVLLSFISLNNVVSEIFYINAAQYEENNIILSDYFFNEDDIEEQDLNYNISFIYEFDTSNINIKSYYKRGEVECLENDLKFCNLSLIIEQVYNLIDNFVNSGKRWSSEFNGNYFTFWRY